jgi:hypothetical protein
MIPAKDKDACMIACLTAQRETARQHHERWVRELRERMSA